MDFTHLFRANFLPVSPKEIKETVPIEQDCILTRPRALFAPSSLTQTPVVVVEIALVELAAGGAAAGVVTSTDHVASAEDVEHVFPEAGGAPEAGRRRPAAAAHAAPPEGGEDEHLGGGVDRVAVSGDRVWQASLLKKER